MQNVSQAFTTVQGITTKPFTQGAGMNTCNRRVNPTQVINNPTASRIQNPGVMRASQDAESSYSVSIKAAKTQWQNQRCNQMDLNMGILNESQPHIQAQTQEKTKNMKSSFFAVAQPPSVGYGINSGLMMENSRRNLANLQMSANAVRHQVPAKNNKKPFFGGFVTSMLMSKKNTKRTDVVMMATVSELVEQSADTKHEFTKQPDQVVMMCKYIISHRRDDVQKLGFIAGDLDMKSPTFANVLASLWLKDHNLGGKGYKVNFFDWMLLQTKDMPGCGEEQEEIQPQSLAELCDIEDDFCMTQNWLKENENKELENLRREISDTCELDYDAVDQVEDWLKTLASGYKYEKFADIVETNLRASSDVVPSDKEMEEGPYIWFEKDQMYKIWCTNGQCFKKSINQKPALESIKKANEMKLVWCDDEIGCVPY